MKTNTLNQKRNAGMTLLELTVVILVLLSLISILFVGARAWKKGSDRAANIMNLRNTQQAMRGEENMKQLVAGTDPFLQANLETYMKFPANIGTAVTYTAGTKITPHNDPATDVTGLWLVTVGGNPTNEYGHTKFTDISGW